MAREVVDLVAHPPLGKPRLAVERFDQHVTNALRSRSCGLTSASEAFALARRIKPSDEEVAMRSAMEVVTAALEGMRDQIEPRRSEVDVSTELHRGLIAGNGEYLSTRLAQAGNRTFPYFNESGANPIRDGYLFCVDTDALGPGGYGVGFSRTFVCGDAAPTAVQRSIHAMALEQLHHNAALLAPGLSFESFARSAWAVPERFAPYGCYCLIYAGFCEACQGTHGREGEYLALMERRASRFSQRQQTYPRSRMDMRP